MSVRNSPMMFGQALPGGLVDRGVIRALSLNYYVVDKEAIWPIARWARKL